MKFYLIQFLFWLLGKLTGRISYGRKPYTQDVFDLMSEARSRGGSGEFKCHQVFARLKKLYPNIDPSDLKLEIELVYQQYFRPR